MKHLLSTTIALTILLGLSCHRDNGPCLTCPPPYTQSILLDTLSIEPTAIAFQLSTRDSTHLGAVQLYRDSLTVFSKTILSSDTTIIDTALLPAHHYRYKVYRLTGDTPIDSSARIVLTTMDTTSHNFTWEIDTLGEVESSWLDDVAIINDTLAYAVGEVYIAGQLYNLARWDGTRWNLLRVLVEDYGGQTGYYRLKCIFAFSRDDIWVSSDGNLIHWDGARWTSKAVFATILPFNGQVNRMWGTSASNLYLVGNSGAIYHYDGTNWQKIPSGTTLDIQDIWGSYNQKTGGWEIIAVAGNTYVSADRKILRLSGLDAMSISDSAIVWPLNSAWFSPNKKYFVAGAGVFEKRFLTDRIWQGPLPATVDYSNMIRGSAINNIFVTGAFGELVHFNGISWRSYTSQTGLSNGQFYSIAVQGNLVFAVGENSPLAVVARGKRN